MPRQGKLSQMPMSAVSALLQLPALEAPSYWGAGQPLGVGQARSGALEEAPIAPEAGVWGSLESAQKLEEWAAPVEA